MGFSEDALRNVLQTLEMKERLVLYLDAIVNVRSWNQ